MDFKVPVHHSKIIDMDIAAITVDNLVENKNKIMEYQINDITSLSYVTIELFVNFNQLYN